MEKERVYIFDTTLRDGEQCRGAAMTLPQKLEMADMLERIGVDIIEAGFPGASLGDLKAVSEIAKRIRSAVVCGLARARLDDIGRAGAALKSAARPRIHTFIGTSPRHMKKLGMTQERVYELVIESVSLSRNLTDDVEWSCEDGTRSECEFLCRLIEAAIHAGATTINIPDTVGITDPDEYFALIRNLRERVPNSDRVVFSVHCHNDLGMAVGNSLAGVKAGARQVECTVMGLGERAGNAALEEIVMAMKVRGMPFETRVDTTQFGPAAKLLSEITGFPIAYNKPIVGRNAFAHGSGIHQDGVLKDRENYEIMEPAAVGAKTSIPLSKHSGRSGLAFRLDLLGHRFSGNRLDELFVRFKALADGKKEVTDEDLQSLVATESA